jgi:hypothetical protein
LIILDKTAEISDYRETMTKYIFALMTCCAALFILLHPLQVKAGRNAVVTAAQVNGTWKNKNGTFHIRALGHQRLQVSFSGVYGYNTPAGPSLNEGEGAGIAFIEGDTAIFKPEEAEDECKITMQFAGDRLSVTQEGSCGFGFRVTAAGIYRKVTDPK